MAALRQLLNWGQQQIRQAKIKSASLDSEVLLAYVLQQPKSFLFAHPAYQPTAKHIAAFKRLVKQRCLGQPIAYLTGHKEFYNLKFKVNRHSLIPRPETELMVEEIIQNLRASSSPHIFIDVGTGSGNIIISVLKNLPLNKKRSLTAIALDNSVQTLKTAHLNAQTYRLQRKIIFARGHLLNPLKRLMPAKPARHLFMAANLPYLPIKIYRQNFNQLKYEPQSALVAKQNGLGLYQQLLRQLKPLLPQLIRHSAVLYFEILPFQCHRLKKIILANFPQAEIKTKKDLSGRTRLFIIKITHKH